MLSPFLIELALCAVILAHVGRKKMTEEDVIAMQNEIDEVSRKWGETGCLADISGDPFRLIGSLSMRSKWC